MPILGMNGSGLTSVGVCSGLYSQNLHSELSPSRILCLEQVTSELALWIQVRVSVLTSSAAMDELLNSPGRGSLLVNTDC